MTTACRSIQGVVLAVVFALLSSLFISVNTIVIRKCLARAEPFTVAALLTAVGALIFWAVGAVALPSGLLFVSTRANLLFIVAGIFAPALVRWLFFASMLRVGTSISSSILATIPAFSAIIAVAFLGERPSPTTAIGLVLIVVGIVLFQGESHGDGSRRIVRRVDLLLPLLAAVVGSIAINLRKLGLEEVDSPVLGAVLGFSSALLVYLILLAVSPKLLRSFRFKARDMPLFLAGGSSLALGWLCIFYALSYGPVVLVAPLASLHPLFVLMLSALVLKDVERVTLRTVAGCCVVLGGVLLVIVI
jgi:drug/metabolite transporter (DMT)-like permease